MADEPSENHDGNTQPLPNFDRPAQTEPIQPGDVSADPLGHVPIASAASFSTPVTSSGGARWTPWLIAGLVLVVIVLLAALVLPQFLSGGVPTPTPTSTTPGPVPSITPTESGNNDGGTDPDPEPPAPDPEPSVEPTVDPPPDPTPTP